jgi:hypothetical protein
MTAPDRDRLSLKLCIVALLDRRKEGVHVDMDDLAGGLVGHGRIFLSYRPLPSLASFR